MVCDLRRWRENFDVASKKKKKRRQRREGMMLRILFFGSVCVCVDFFTRRNHRMIPKKDTHTFDTPIVEGGVTERVIIVGLLFGSTII